MYDLLCDLDGREYCDVIGRFDGGHRDGHVGGAGSLWVRMAGCSGVLVHWISSFQPGTVTSTIE